VLFVRHGQTATTGQILPGRAEGLSLSTQGNKQATEVAKRLRTSGIRPAAIYSSPMERAQETAAPIAKIFDLGVQIENGLIEMDFGDWTGKKLNHLRKLDEWQTIQNEPSIFRFPNGESFKDMQQRLTKTLEQLRKTHINQTIVVVSHADTIKATLTAALGMPLNNFQRLVISTCSVSAVLYSDKSASVMFINNVGLELPKLKFS
jgi:probable phosphomutase (TIGR03848 family)